MNASLDIHEHVLPPEPVSDLLVRDERRAPLHEQDQEVHGAPLQPYGAVDTKKLEAAEIERKLTKANDFG